MSLRHQNRSDVTPREGPPAVLSILLAGALATVAFDLFGQGFSPLFGFARLAPVGPANSVLSAVFGAVPKGGAETLHFLTGLVAYPVGWLFIARPLWLRIAPALHWSVAAAGYGFSRLHHGASRRGPSDLSEFYRHHLGGAHRPCAFRSGLRWGDRASADDAIIPA